MNDGGLSFPWLALGLTTTLLAVAAWFWARKQRRAAGLPAGDIIYTDGGTWYRQHDPLFDPELRLVGRPDYLVEEETGFIAPVEVKSAKAPSQPHEGHILQLAAYCLLVEAEYGVRPSYGILQYRDKAFAVDFTLDLEEDLLDLLAEMREALYVENLDRDHQSWPRCARCGVRQHCDQRLPSRSSVPAVSGPLN